MGREADWSAVDALFAELVDLPPPERAARLAAYPGDPAVPAEVAELLAALAEDRVDLEPSPGASHLTLAGTSATLDISLAGRRLGPWAVVREVGRGGMGAVYEAFRADDQYQKRVAIKTLAGGADREAVARRFQQERQILASLEHPGIATLLDGGVTDEGLPYLVMEFVDGEPLDRFCEVRRVPLRERLDLFRQVCAAVQHAHRNLVVHRDLKPSNILVSADGVVTLVDFGIAKLLADHPAHGATLTETGARAFTTGYASPEQIRGEPISTATDVYSLGVTLYRILAGRLPFDLAQRSAPEAVRMICEEPATAPSRTCTDAAAREARLPGRAALARELAGELDDIVLAALRKEPERRYPTVAALSDDLKRYLQGQQVSARPDTWRYRVRSFGRRNRPLVAAAGLGLLFLAAGAGLATWQAMQAARERDRARDEAARSSRIVSFIEQTLAAPVHGALTEGAIQLLDHAVGRAVAELADDPLARAAVYRTAASAFTIHVRGERARPLLDSALALDRRHAGEESAEVGRDLTILARLAYLAGRLDSAVHYSSEAVRLLRSRPSDRPADLATALLYHSFALTYAGRPEEALVVAREGLALEGSRLPATLRPYLTMAVGEAEVFRGQFAEGEAAYRRALTEYDSLPLSEPAERGVAELGVANLLSNRGAHAEAESHARRALAILERHWGPEHSYTGRAHAVLGRLALARGAPEAARAEFASALGALEGGRLGLVDRVSIELDYARGLVAVGGADEAVARLRTLLESSADELAPSPLLMSLVEEYTGEVLIRARRLGDARPLLEAAHQRRVALFGAGHPFSRTTATTLVFLAGAVGDDSLASRHAAVLSADSVRAISGRGRAWAAAQ